MSYVNYDIRSMINAYDQTEDSPTFEKECAAVSAGMCVKKSPQQLLADGFIVGECDWSGIAKKYDYTLASDDSASAQKLFDILKSGYPTVVKVNNEDSHWVVVYKYEGLDNTILLANFRCIDPWGAADVNLQLCQKYKGIYKTRTFKK